MFDEKNSMLILCPKKFRRKKWVMIMKHKIFSTHIIYEKRLQTIHTNNKSRFTEKNTHTKKKHLKKRIIKSTRKMCCSTREKNFLSIS